MNDGYLRFHFNYRKTSTYYQISSRLQSIESDMGAVKDAIICVIPIPHKKPEAVLEISNIGKG